MDLSQWATIGPLGKAVIEEKSAQLMNHPAEVEMVRGANQDLFPQREKRRAKIISRMNELNGAISEDEINLGEGFQIGHSFFTPTPGDGPFDDAWYRRVVTNEIIPLIKEYWFDNREEVDRWQERLLD